MCSLTLTLEITGSDIFYFHFRGCNGYWGISNVGQVFSGVAAGEGCLVLLRCLVGLDLERESENVRKDDARG